MTFKFYESFFLHIFLNDYFWINYIFLCYAICLNEICWLKFYLKMKWLKSKGKNLSDVLPDFYRDFMLIVR